MPLRMAEAFKERLQQPSPHQLSFEGRFGFLADRQWIWKEDCRIKQLLEEAKLKINACVEDIDYKFPRGIDHSVIWESQQSPLSWLIIRRLLDSNPMRFSNNF